MHRSAGGTATNNFGESFELLRENCAPILTNSSTELDFWFTMGDLPHTSLTPIAQAKWAILGSKVDTLTPDFEDIGSPNSVEGLTGQDEAAATQTVFTVRKKGLALEHARTYYIHIWLCDALANCAMRRSYPYFVDLTPPELPPAALAHYLDENITYFTRPYQIFPGWLDPNTRLPTLTSTDCSSGRPGTVDCTDADIERVNEWTGNDMVPDVEAMMLQNAPGTYHVMAQWELLKQDNETGLLHPFIGWVNATTKSEGFLELLGYPETMEEGGCNGRTLQSPQRQQCIERTLVLGHFYVVHVMAINPAGSISHAWSKPIMADYTVPWCEIPKMYAMDDQLTNFVADVGVGLGLDSATAWIGPESKGFKLSISPKTCTDPESGITNISVGLGSEWGQGRPDGTTGVSDRMADMVMPELLDSASLIKEMTISLDPYPWEPNFDESVKVNIWCTNGAALIDECHSHRGMPEFRVDTTPPHCFEHVIFISEMDAYPWVQHYDDRLWVDFHAGLDDWQVRLHDVEYKLEDVAPTIEAAGGNWCGGQWCAQYRNADVTGTMTSLTTLNHKGSPPDPAYLRGLNLTHGHYYRILAMARNNVGMYMDEWCPSPWVLIDTTPPTTGTITVVPTAEDRYAANPEATATGWTWNTLALHIAVRGWKDEESGLENYFMDLIDVEMGTPLIQDQFLPVSDQISVSVKLYHLQVVQIHWTAVNHATLTASSESGYVTVDATPPVIDYVADFDIGSAEKDLVGGADLDYELFFGTHDPESGILKTEYCVGGFPGACDKFGRQEVNHRWRHAVAGVSLLEGFKYYGTLFVTNGAGNIAFRTTDGFMVDASPPICGAVYDGAAYDKQFIGPSVGNEVQVSWHSFSDLASGIAQYAVAVVPVAIAADKNFSMVPVGLASSASIAVAGFAHGLEYVTVVRAVDLMGYEVDCESDGFTADFTPPEYNTSFPLASLLASPQLLDHVVQAEWPGFDDPESGIREFFVALGTEDEPESVQAFRSVGVERSALLSGLELPQGIVLLTVRAVNGAELSTEVSLEIIVDTEPPECEILIQNSTEPLTAGHLAFLNVSWSCVDPYPGSVSWTKWAIGSEPGLDDFKEWDDVDAVASYSYADPPFEDGKPYYVSIEAQDAVGFSTDILVAPRILIDLEPPYVASNATVVTSDGRALRWSTRNTSVHAYWEFLDSTSGIASVRWAVTASGGSAPAFESMVEADLDIHVRGGELELPFTLLHDTEYKLHACAADHVGYTVCSAPYEFRVDLTPPECEDPVVLLEGMPAPAYFFFPGALDASWSCTDPESGVPSVVVPRAQEWRRHLHAPRQLRGRDG